LFENTSIGTLEGDTSIVNLPNNIGEVPLQVALMKNRLNAAKALIKWGAHEMPMEDGYDILHMAAKCGDSDTVKWVFENTERLWIDSEHFRLALDNGHFETAKLLASLAPTVNESNLLHVDGSVECINWVLSNTTINVNSTDRWGTTPLHIAAGASVEISELLVIKNGANLFKQNVNGKHPLEYGLGSKILKTAKDLRWSAIKEGVLLLKSCESAERRKSILCLDDDDATIAARLRSARLSASVLGYYYFKAIIISYLIRTEIIVRDPSIPLPPKQTDDVKRRIEAELNRRLK
jgi:hypothetical protein